MDQSKKHSNTRHINNQSMVCYQCGNIRRVFKSPEPERRPTLLPDTRIWISLRGGTDRGSLEDLSFISLLPKPVIKHYLSTLTKECEYEISQKGELVAKLENKTREISQMLNNLNKITATPEKKKKTPTTSNHENDAKDEVKIILNGDEKEQSMEETVTADAKDSETKEN